ncbi:MAG: electron transfer flavoprotein subunit alpha/FixB family protein [Gemmatimonadetes bacterium]|nr:electron transfer flavoprotein subunit alpha/FixB family protein [Gemmatimonadota bacterium]
MQNILAIAEQRDGALRSVSAEVTTAARSLADTLGGEVHVLVVGGPGIDATAAGLGAWGADRILIAEAEHLSQYSPEALTALAAERVRAADYYAVLLPASAMGRDLAPRIAARLEQPLATDVTAILVEDGELVVTRPVYAGRLIATIGLHGSPRFVSIRPNVFRPVEKAGRGEVEKVPPGDASGWRVTVEAFEAAEGGNLDVAEAPIVVSGGRGMNGPENWGLLEDLRAALGPTAALGASRAVVDAGWRPHAEQVGQTGKTVSPQLYFAVAISGAMQHLAGMRSSAVIVAINKDADAPIFKVADYGIVGDVRDILPRLAAQIRKARGA